MRKDRNSIVNTIDEHHLEYEDDYEKQVKEKLKLFCEKTLEKCGEESLERLKSDACYTYQHNEAKKRWKIDDLKLCQFNSSHFHPDCNMGLYNNRRVSRSFTSEASE